MISLQFDRMADIIAKSCYGRAACIFSNKKQQGFIETLALSDVIQGTRRRKNGIG